MRKNELESITKELVEIKTEIALLRQQLVRQEEELVGKL